MDELRFLKEENRRLRVEIENLKQKIENKKRGMIKKAQNGKIMSRAPFGYEIRDGQLIPSQNSKVVENIFLDFQNTNMSLNSLSKKYGFSLNGLKKILTNFTYLGKIKFNKEIHGGIHKPLLSSILFNHVQDKLERKGIKKIC